MDVRRKQPWLAVMMLGLGLAACAGGEEMEEEMAMEIPLPDTTGAATWAYLQEVDYRTSWRLWPGKGELYTGTEPHGMLLTTYLNEAAYDAVANNTGSLPVGAMIVKENYMPDSTLAAVTTMHKVQGYNPDHNDWFFLKSAPDGTVQAEGRAQGCQNCHGGMADNDYIMTASLSN